MILVVPVTEPKPVSLTEARSAIAARDAVHQALAFVRINQICQEMMK